MRLLYKAVRTFGPHKGREWTQFVQWLGAPQLRELITLAEDQCPSVIPAPQGADWRYIEDKDFRLQFYRDLDYLRVRIAPLAAEDVQILAAVEEPEEPPTVDPPGFIFKGYDLLDACGDISILTGCRWRQVAPELSPWGLINSYTRAQELRELWHRIELEGGHKPANVWAVWRLGR